MRARAALGAAFGADLGVRIAGAASTRALATFKPLEHSIDSGKHATANTDTIQLAGKDVGLNLATSAAAHMCDVLGRDQT